MTALDTLAQTLAGVLLGCGDKVVHHPDCFFLRPSNKMRSISAEDVRSLIQSLSMTANQGGGKVAILYEVDRMNTTASNILLKTLEEPSPDTTLLLLSTQPYKLLPTIRSRTFHFRLPSLKDTISEPNWQLWLGRYQQWLKGLQLSLNQASERAQMVLTAYNLVVHFEAVLGEMSSAAWKEELKSLPDTLSAEQQTALEVGAYKSILRRLLASVAEHTRHYGVSLLKSNPAISSTALARSIEVLEHVAGLLEVNLNEATALEHFLLQSLKIWRE